MYLSKVWADIKSLLLLTSRVESQVSLNLLELYWQWSMDHNSRHYMSHSLYLSWLNEGLKYDMLDMHLVLVIIEFCQLNNIVLENVLKLLSDHWSELVTIMEEARLLIDEPSPGERWCLVFVFLWSVSNCKMNPGKRVGGTGLQCPRNRPNGAKGLGKLGHRVFETVLGAVSQWS